MLRLKRCHALLSPANPPDARPQSIPFRATRRRHGGSTWIVVLVIAFMLVAGGVVGYFLLADDSSLGEEPLLAEAIKGEFVHDVVDQGAVESSNNVEIKCTVKARDRAGTIILSVIPEGTMVKKGDEVVQLDSSALEAERDQQQINLNTSRALKEQAENSVNAAKTALEEYRDGLFLQELKGIEAEILVAQENYRRAVEYARYSERLAAKGYVTQLQLEADLFAVEKAETDKQIAEKKRDVLNQFTRDKNLKTLQSELNTAEAKFKAEVHSYALEEKKLQELEEAIAGCTIYSPEAGQVVHANTFSGRGNAEFVVEEGASVREGQSIIRIPDPTQMQVKTSVNEARVTLIDVGMPATITFEAFANQEFRGEVVKVNQYAEPSSWTSGNVKEYATYVKIIDPPANLRPGQTAAVEIHVEQRSQAIQVPVQALVEHEGRMFILVKVEDGYETRKVEIGSSNDKTVTIESGNLREGEQVAMYPRRYKQLLELPDNLPPLPKPEKPKKAEKPKKRPSANDAFKKYDSDGDGNLSSGELAAAGKFGEMLKAADKDADGAVSKSEFLAAMAKLKAAGGPPGGGAPGGGRPGGGGAAGGRAPAGG